MRNFLFEAVEESPEMQEATLALSLRERPLFVYTSKFKPETACRRSHPTLHATHRATVRLARAHRTLGAQYPEENRAHWIAEVFGEPDRSP